MEASGSARSPRCLGSHGRGSSPCYILDCEDHEEALQWAESIPAARYGAIEVRPVMTMPGHYSADQDSADQDSADQDGGGVPLGTSFPSKS